VSKQPAVVPGPLHRLKAPMGDNEIIEVRQVQEFEDFPQDVQEKVGDFALGDADTRSGGRGVS